MIVVDDSWAWGGTNWMSESDLLLCLIGLVLGKVNESNNGEEYELNWFKSFELELVDGKLKFEFEFEENCCWFCWWFWSSIPPSDKVSLSELVGIPLEIGG